MTTATQLPAILGGEPAVSIDQTEALRWPLIDEQDEDAVLDVLRSGHLSLHPIVEELENQYKERTGRQFALTHNNGTSAILAGLQALGIQPFDEVIVPSATWWSTTRCLTYPECTSSSNRSMME